MRKPQEPDLGQRNVGPLPYGTICRDCEHFGRMLLFLGGMESESATDLKP